jgi:hypothetical protein
VSDGLDARRASGIVNALVDQDVARCTCGAEIDVSDADTTGTVVEALETHRQECENA